MITLDMKTVERDASDVHWVNVAIPAPQSFRDMDASFERGRAVYFGSPVATATCSVVVYALRGAAFAALLAFYSLPSQYVTASVVGTSWSLAGFDCEPLQGDARYGVSYSYSECLANIAEPNSETVVSSSLGVGYTFFPFFNNVGIAKDPAQNNPINAEYYGVADIDPAISVCTSTSTVGLFVCSGASKSQAITAFKQIVTFYGGIEGLCEFTKTNSPFQCTREKPIEAKLLDTHDYDCFKIQEMKRSSKEN